MADLKSWLRLARVPGLHAGRMGPLLEAGRSPLELLSAPDRELAALGLRGNVRDTIRTADDAGIERDLAWLDASASRTLVTWGDPRYPPRLAAIADAPLVLYVEGDPDVLSQVQLAVVGSRHPTAAGRETAEQFAAHLAGAGLVITSGLALGVDAAAHRGALAAGGLTVAVVGRGLDDTYPRENRALAAQILASGGALVSIFPVGCPAVPENFPRRNRILSGLCVGTLVVEAALRSGSLLTARLAAEQGREVFAIPGSIHNVLAHGCHRLLRDGAKLVERAQDIFEELAPIVSEHALKPPATRQYPTTLDMVSLDKDSQILLDAVGFETTGLDQIVARTGFEAGAVASMLLMLELDGRVLQQPGGRYCRRPPGR